MFKLKNKIGLLLLSTAFTLSACMSTPAYDPNLTPQQNKERQRNAQYNRTLGSGALTGVLAGALIGGLAGKGKGAAIGALSGAAVGSGAGYLIANRTERQQLTEDNLNNAIAQAHQIAVSAEDDAKNALAYVTEAQSEILTLNQKIRSGKLSKVQSQKQLAEIQSLSNKANKVSQDINERINFYTQENQKIQHVYQLTNDPRMNQQAQSIDDSIRRLKYAENILVTSMESTPKS
ncbi:MAG: glycine zipper domain-containing protein [Commensalibacter sp.]